MNSTGHEEGDDKSLIIKDIDVNKVRLTFVLYSSAIACIAFVLAIESRKTICKVVRPLMAMANTMYLTVVQQLNQEYEIGPQRRRSNNKVAPLTADQARVVVIECKPGTSKQN